MANTSILKGIILMLTFCRITCLTNKEEMRIENELFDWVE